jgi:hypothetical protein
VTAILHQMMKTILHQITSKIFVRQTSSRINSCRAYGHSVSTKEFCPDISFPNTSASDCLWNG